MVVTYARVQRQVLDRLESALPAGAATELQAEVLAQVAHHIRRSFETDDPRNLLCVHIPFTIATGLGAPIELAELAATACTAVYGAARVVDDVMDGQPVSFGVSSRETVLALAVTLCASAYRLVALSPDLGVNGVAAVTAEVADMITVMAAGQLAEAKAAGLLSTPAEVVESVGQKSGAMAAAFARCGAIVASAQNADVERCGQFGAALGSARQLRSDLAELEALNPVDASNAVSTLAVAVHAWSLPDEDRADFAQRYRGSAESSWAREQMLREIDGSGGLGVSGLQIEVLLDRAAAAVLALPLEAQACHQLLELVDFTSL
jgi:geranylgeranyl pyrophosphate synthase